MNYFLKFHKKQPLGMTKTKSKNNFKNAFPVLGCKNIAHSQQYS
jgi:hypothetical protein